MFGPGADVPDPTEGLVDVQDLPTPQRMTDSRHHQHTPCPRCGPRSSRHQAGQRTVHDLGDVSTDRPVALLVPSAAHDGSTCRPYGTIARSDVAPPGSHDTHRVTQRAGRLVVEDRVPSRPASGHLWRDHRVVVPCVTIQPWVEAGGNTGAQCHGWGVSG